MTPRTPNAPMTLTESQKNCLRLVAQGMTSKEIAQHIGLTPSTVDTYLKIACTRLGAENRRDAARRFLEAERSQGLGSQPPALPEADDPPHDAGRRGEAERPNGWIRSAITPPPIGGSTNDLNSSDRLLAMLRAACLMAMIMSALVLFSIGVIRLLS